MAPVRDRARNTCNTSMGCGIVLVDGQADLLMVSKPGAGRAPERHVSGLLVG